MDKVTFKKSLINLFWGSLAFLFFTNEASAQVLKPGFEKSEYIEVLKMAHSVSDTPFVSKRMVPKEFKLAYRSQVTGLDNRWDLWVSDKKVAAISIRGTTPNQISWLENFYAAMIPAQGTIKLNNDIEVDYLLSDNPRAAVHSGWTIASAFLMQTILPKIDSCYKAGYRDFIITGHSQGGAISFLITSWVRHLQKDGKIPQDIVFKTYSSAAPKPGNLYYAYDYESLTQNGYAFNVVNSADWVPETPLSVQTTDDFNPLNPFRNASETIKKQKFPVRTAMKIAYRKLDRHPRKAVKNYRKYLGNFTGKMAAKVHPELQIPDFSNTSNYARTGRTIVLYADDVYYQVFPDKGENIFIHHMTTPYLYLLEKLQD
ncbi:MAG: lipase family protein [Lentimicrobium sp.]|nr:lipase family protein [Lentimicrobium sp.]